MSKKPKLTNQQKELIYALYDKNMNTKYKPDYEGIMLALMKMSPPILITKAAICYQIKRRTAKSTLQIEEAREALDQAKKSHEDLTGTQSSELDFSPPEDSTKITIANAPIMLKYWDAQTAKFKLELDQGRYVHKDEVATQLIEVYERATSTLESVKTRLISSITPHILCGDNTAASHILDQEFSNIIHEIEDAILEENSCL